ncbi:hypothetical protein BR10RB9215_C20881 [Brucella sp. 10RB9215]|nr:hypothetical protein BR10RB9215_C20881 [Brucella sp. 10RB9215]
MGAQRLLEVLLRDVENLIVVRVRTRGVFAADNDPGAIRQLFHSIDDESIRLC